METKNKMIAGKKGISWQTLIVIIAIIAVFTLLYIIIWRLGARIPQ